jgi:hypothetical protein
MNSLKSTLFLSLFLLIIFSSCDNEPLTGNFEDESGIISDSNGNLPENNLTPFFAKVESIEFNEDLLQSYILNNKLWVRGTDLDSNKLTIGFPTDIVEGTYEITNENEAYQGLFLENISNTLARANTGTIVIVSHDTESNTISGTFSFIATPSGNPTPEFEVTEGEFNVSY